MKKILFLIALLMISSIYANDLRLVLLNPYAKFNINESQTIDYYVAVQNKNNFEIQVNISQPTTSGTFNFNGPANFNLAINETKYVNFTYNPTVNETISILVMFISENKTMALSETIVTRINGNTVQTSSQESGSQSSGQTDSGSGNVVKYADPKVDKSQQTNQVTFNSDKNIDPINSSSPQESSNTKVLIVIAILVIVLVIGIGIFILISMKGGKQNEETNNNVDVDDNIPSE